jgi:uncharacterized protein involved in exopolysaccharide biosynthesis
MSEQSFNKSLANEISLKDTIIFFLESWKLIAICGVVGGLLATVYAFVLPAKYMAIANIQVAKVAGADIETPGALLEKIKMPMYYTATSYSACNMMDNIESGESIAKNINPVLLKAAPIIKISYISDSPEDATRCIDGIFSEIRRSQNLLANPILEIKKSQLTVLKKKLDDVEKVIKILPNKNLNLDFSDSNFSSYNIFLSVRLIKENEIKELRTQINELEISLAEPYTKDAFLTTPIYASRYKVSPKRSLILMIGLVVGLFLGALFTISKRSWLALKISN